MPRYLSTHPGVGWLDCDNEGGANGGSTEYESQSATPNEIQNTNVMREDPFLGALYVLLPWAK